MSPVRNRRLPVVVAFALIVSLGLAGCQLGRPQPPAQTSQGSTVTTSEFSTLDTAGVDRIRTSKQARLDMSTGSLLKSTVRLAENSYGPEINTQDSGKIALSIVGPKSEITGETDRIRFNTTDVRTDFSEVTFFLTTDSLDSYVSLLRDGVQRYGIDSQDTERWITSVKDDPSSKSDYALTSGTSTGLEVNYDLRYDGSQETQVIIVHVSSAV